MQNVPTDRVIAIASSLFAKGFYETRVYRFELIYSPRKNVFFRSRHKPTGRVYSYGTDAFAAALHFARMEIYEVHLGEVTKKTRRVSSDYQRAAA